MRPKRDLLRIALAGDPPRPVADPAAQLPGRGAYVCDRACAERALDRRAFPRAFRRRVDEDRSLLRWLD